MIAQIVVGPGDNKKLNEMVVVPNLAARSDERTLMHAASILIMG